ncbi:hypothetical protein Nmel_011312 [Mimus melanotis]
MKFLIKVSSPFETAVLSRARCGCAQFPDLPLSREHHSCHCSASPVPPRQQHLRRRNLH